MHPDVGLDAFAYRRRGMRPARNALRPALTPSRIASAISTGSRAWAIAVFKRTPWQPSSIATATSLAVPTPAFVRSAWDPVSGDFGALPFIFGTLATSLLALAMAVPLAMGVAIFLTELCPAKLRAPISFVTELLAAIPSVVYGLWAVFVLVPLMRDTLGPFLYKYLGWTGFFEGFNFGEGLLTASIILAIMILPIISSITRDIMLAVPISQREAVLALGATRWEMIRTGVLRNARIGIVGAVILGLGRALGETMAVTMVIGNHPDISKSLFAPGYTLASVIANEFSEATGDMYLSALIEIGLALFLVTIVVNAIARALVWAVTRGTPARVH